SLSRLFFFFSSRRRHTRFSRDWSSDVCSSDLGRSFHAGRDTRVLGQRDPKDSDFNFVKRAQKLQHAFLDCSKPIIAALKGACIEIGRASCRERVESTEVAESVEETTKIRYQAR